MLILVMLACVIGALSMAAVQSVQVHPGKTYDIEASAKEESGEPIALTNLRFTPETSDVGYAGDDPDTNDDNAYLVTKDQGGEPVSVGAIATLNFTADGPDGRKFEADADVTVVEESVEIEAMSLTFTEVTE